MDKKKQHILGIRLARTLLAECPPDLSAEHSLRRPRTHVLIDDLSDIHRPKINAEVLKHVRQQALAHPELAFIFCYVTGEALQQGDVDADHLEPYACFSKRLLALATYLNEETEVARAFLGELNAAELRQLSESPTKQKARKAVLQHYVRKDRNKKLCITQYFLTVAFNQVENILPVKHAVNLQKSSTEIVKFLQGAMPMPLWNSLEKQGGIHSGVIFKRVIPVEQCTTIQLTEEVSALLHAGLGKALAPAIQAWFAQTVDIKSHSAKLSSVYRTAVEALRQDWAKTFKARGSKVDKVWKQQLQSLKDVVEAFSYFRENPPREGSVDSSSGSEGERRIPNRQSFINDLKEYIVNKGPQSFSRLRDFILEYVVPEDVATVKQHFYGWCLEHKGSLQASGVIEALEAYEPQWRQMNPLLHSKSADDIKKTVQTVVRNYTPAQMRLIHAKQLTQKDIQHAKQLAEKDALINKLKRRLPQAEIDLLDEETAQESAPKRVKRTSPKRC